MDGVDAVLASFGTQGAQIHQTRSLPMPAALRAELLALQHPGHNELARASIAAVQLTELYAQACLPWTQGAEKKLIRAIGVHGQTIRHAPDQGYTLQLNAPALLAERCGGRTDLVAAAHSVRIAVVVLSVPFAMQWARQHWQLEALDMMPPGPRVAEWPGLLWLVPMRDPDDEAADMAPVPGAAEAVPARKAA